MSFESKIAFNDANFDAEATMRTTITVSDDLVERASALTGRTEPSVLVRLGLEALIERESSRRLALLGGTDPSAEAGERRKSASE